MSKKLLLHCCCAPCTSGVVPQLIDNFDITLFFFNPNIDTEFEFNRRLKTMEQYVEEYFKHTGKKLELIVIPYDHLEFQQTAMFLDKEPEGGARCSFCMKLRLDYTAKYAKEHGYDLFCSTLSVSPHKNHQHINDLGESVAEKYGANYLPNNFKKNDGFLLSVTTSYEYKLYRQKYCGCEYAKSHIDPNEEFMEILLSDKEPKELSQAKKK